jgi:2,3-bisphosphoglycerate-independent phosphoglycerate mutase
MILDGFGERAETADNAVRMATTPALDSLNARYPHGVIGTSGPDVGLPPGQMGNSEVGHLNFGAGRIAMMDISRIDNAIYDGSIRDNRVIVDTFDAARRAGGHVHLLGLLSDGGVHSSIAHLLVLIDLAHQRGAPVIVHAFLDGRDVQPGTALTYIADLEARLVGKGTLGSVSGRYFAMDRDNRWERVEKAYRAIVHAEGVRFATAHDGVAASFAAGKSDEFVEPFVVGNYVGVSTSRDSALHTNFRPDRARELTRALATPSFSEFARNAAPFKTYACTTTYDASLGLRVAFPKESLSEIFPEVLQMHGMTQFRCAETEKYAHVTYFFNGGREEPFAGEDRKMVPSPKEVATYDEKPEMSAKGVADEVVKAIETGKYDFILVNFANPDMVGHTGMLGPAIHAVEAVDLGIGRIAAAVQKQKGALLVTADHGNCELMKDPASGNPHTAHTLNPVPLIYMNDADTHAEIRGGGRICDVAPTMLSIMGLPQPAAMTGVSLLMRDRNGHGG